MLLAEETHAVTQAVSAQAVSGGVEGASWLLIGFPLFGAAVLLLGGRRTDKWGHLLGCLMPLASFAYGVVLFFNMLGRPASARSHSVHVFEWIATGAFKVDVGMLLDPLSLSFVLLITGVGSLIHIYSIGYMSHDENRRKFFAFLNLFVAAMLLLVLANNFVGLYVGWEGVGLASYLLIGFWQHKPSAAVAAKKAFIVNRVGDFGLSVAIMLMFATFNNVSFEGVFAHVSQAHSGTVTAIGLLLLLGACGKSAQVPLQSWLLDAMEGPTPVSALIHAATMVTAGVYLIVRSNPIFNASPDAQLVVTIVGAVTLLAGAIIGCAKDDIKKALAGSTMSQIGYMILAAGLGPIGYAAAIAHLLSHGFFKAGLFLGAGSIMHGMNEEVNMRKYGGLAKYMPITFATFGLAYLAIIGFPDLAGWWTKDAIIEAALKKGTTTGLILGAAAIVGAALTAYYMSRVMFMTFFGEKRWDEGAHPHESPGSMTVPMIVLAVGSLIGGGFLVYGGRFANFLAPVVGETEIKPTAFLPATTPSLILLVLMLAGVALAWFQYGRKSVPATAPRGHLLTWWARRDLGGDAINETLFMRPGQWLTRIAVYFDNRGVDGIVNSVAATIGGTSGRLRRWQTGFVRSYALSMFLGAALVVAALLMVRL